MVYYLHRGESRVDRESGDSIEELSGCGKEARRDFIKVVRGVRAELEAPCATIDFHRDMGVASEVSTVMVEIVDYGELAAHELDDRSALRLRVAAAIAGGGGVCEWI